MKNEKLDPKLTAAKVYPIDPIREVYEEEAYPDADPQLDPMTTYERVLGLVLGAAAFGIIVVCIFH